MATALLLGSLDPPHPSSRAEADPVSAQRVDPELLADLQALRDEAEALTRAEVALDERAAERWMPRVAQIELARDDPATPPLLRRELDATIVALVRVGLLSDPLVSVPH